eukprot:1144777-Pelagomonas_calceolata.AAC.2
MLSEIQCPVLGAFPWSKRPWQQGMSHVHLYFVRASQQRLRAVLCLFMNIPWHAGCEHPRTM